MYFKAISTRVACLLFLASLCANAFATSASVAVGGGTLFYTETTPVIATTVGLQPIHNIERPMLNLLSSAPRPKFHLILADR